MTTLADLPVVHALRLRRQGVDRRCGPCVACCVLPERPGKPCGMACPALLPSPGRGCCIYPGRPADCAAFACLWLIGALRDDQRPDRIGLLAFHRLWWDVPALIVLAPSVSAVNAAAGQELVATCREACGTVAVIAQGSTWWVGRQAARAVQLAEEHPGGPPAAPRHRMIVELLVPPGEGEG